MMLHNKTDRAYEYSSHIFLFLFHLSFTASEHIFFFFPGHGCERSVSAILLIFITYDFGIKVTFGSAQVPYWYDMYSALNVTLLFYNYFFLSTQINTLLTFQTIFLCGAAILLVMKEEEW